MAIRRKNESIQAYRKRIAKRRAETKGKTVREQLKDTKKAIGSSITKTKNKAKDKLGIARTKVKTKGGDFPVYGKDSKKAKSFRAAYAASEKAFKEKGTKTFTWEGKRYKSKGADKPASKPGVKPKPKFDPNKPLVTSNTSTIKTKMDPNTKPRKKKNFIETASPRLKANDGTTVTKEDLAKIRENRKKTVKKETVAQRNRRLRMERNKRRKNKR